MADKSSESLDMLATFETSALPLLEERKQQKSQTKELNQIIMT